MTKLAQKRWSCRGRWLGEEYGAENGVERWPISSRQTTANQNEREVRKEKVGLFFSLGSCSSFNPAWEALVQIGNRNGGNVVICTSLLASTLGRISFVWRRTVLVFTPEALALFSVRGC